VTRLVLTTMTLRSLWKPLAVRLTTTTVMVLRPRRILRMRRALRTWSTLRMRTRLTTTATRKLVRGRLGRTTRTRSLRRVVHLVSLIDVRLNAVVRGTTGPSRMVVMRHIYVRRLVVDTTACPTAVEFRTVTGPTARAAVDLSATSGSRRPVASSGHVIRATVAGPAMIGSVNIRPASGTMVISAVLISTLVGRTRSGSYHPST